MLGDGPSGLTFAGISGSFGGAGVSAVNDN